MKKLKIYMVRTENVCFVSACMATDGYDWEYHSSSIKELYFDDELPKKTFTPNWLQINKFPNKIERLISPQTINRRYEIKNKDLVSERLPESFLGCDRDNYSEEVLGLYCYKSDQPESVLEPVDYEIDIVFEIENFEIPSVINYKAITKTGFDDNIFNFTNVNIKHQLLDKLIFPEIMLHSRPCEISSYNLYCVARQHIKDNIDLKVAKITSDYDFCFSVAKIIPLLEPQKYSYQNFSGKTKRERSKIRFAIKEYKEVRIFEMTHAQSKYDNYTEISGIFADNEVELKEKIDFYLEDLISTINKPLSLCPHCNGMGYEKY